MVTVCYGESMRELRDVMTVQKLVEKSRSNPDSAVYNSRMPPRWEDNLSISIVSSAKEKQEIRKVYESAKGKMQACQEQVIKRMQQESALHNGIPKAILISRSALVTNDQTYL